MNKREDENIPSFFPTLLNLIVGYDNVKNVINIDVWAVLLQRSS